MNTHDGTAVSGGNANACTDTTQSIHSNQPMARRSFLALAPLLAAGASHGALASEPRPDMGGDIVNTRRLGNDSESGETNLEISDSSRNQFGICFLELAADLEVFFLCYPGKESDPGSLILTDERGRLMYCMDVDKIPELIALGKPELVGFEAPDVDSYGYASVPDAMEELQEGLAPGMCGAFWYLLDVLTDLLYSAGYSRDDSLFCFLMECFMRIFMKDDCSFDETPAEHLYCDLSVEEGIQLALGIVLARGRLVD